MHMDFVEKVVAKCIISLFVGKIKQLRTSDDCDMVVVLSNVNSD